MTERGEGGENHCNHTWGSVLTDGLWLQDPGPWAACWAPTCHGKSPEAAQQLSPQEFSCPHKGPPNMEPLLLDNRENIILPLRNVVIQLPDQSLWSCTCSLDSLCLGPAAQSTWLGKSGAAGAQSGWIVFVYSWPSKDAETAQVLTQTGATFGLI